MAVRQWIMAVQCLIGEEGQVRQRSQPNFRRPPPSRPCIILTRFPVTNRPAFPGNPGRTYFTNPAGNVSVGIANRSSPEGGSDK